MITRRLVTIIALSILLVPAVTTAADQLWPLRTGLWAEADKTDSLGHQWMVRVSVLEEANLGGQNYFHIRELCYDPGEWDVLGDFYVRSTDTELYIYNGPGLGETLAFKLGPVGTSWIYDGGTKKKEIVAIENITIPYGGPYTAYKFKHYKLSDPTKYDFEWIVPGLLGVAKEEDHWVSDSARIPIISVMGRLGQVPAEVLGDINSNGKIDLTEAIYALQIVAGLKPDVAFNISVWDFAVTYENSSCPDHPEGGVLNAAISITQEGSIVILNSPEIAWGRPVTRGAPMPGTLIGSTLTATFYEPPRPNDECPTCSWTETVNGTLSEDGNSMVGTIEKLGAGGECSASASFVATKR